MGLGPTAVIGYMNEDGNWTPVTSEKGLPVTGGGGGGGGAVASVNGQTGEVVLTSEDIEITYTDALGTERTEPVSEVVGDVVQVVGNHDTNFALILQSVVYFNGQDWVILPGVGLDQYQSSPSPAHQIFIGGSESDLPEFFDPDQHVHLSQEFLDGSAVSAEINALQSTVADLEARLEALENPEEG